MRATDGTTWLPIAQSAARHRLRVATVRQAITDKRVAAWRLSNRTWVRDDDVADLERDWWRRAGRQGA